MNSKPLRTLMVVCALVALAANGHLQQVLNTYSISESEISVLRNLPNWQFTTKAYQEEALRLMVEEANRVAAVLPLGEQLPITRSNLLEYHVGPPGLVRLGFVATTNYHYIFERKLCALVQTDIVARFYEAKAKYSWPMSRMDTNKAYQIATQLMTAVSMDVAALNRDCTIEVTLPDREGLIKPHFFPHYWVNWRKSGETVAFVEFVEPSKSILQLDVRPNYVRYNLREPIRIPNLAVLLNQTNTPLKRSKYLAYNYVGLAALVAEMGFTAERLGLPVQRPIQESQLTLKWIFDPATCRRFGGQVEGGGYWFCERDYPPNEREGQAARMFAISHAYGEGSAVSHLLHSKSLITTNQAYQLAAGWLRAIDVDVQELEKANKAEVQQLWGPGLSGRREEFLTPIFDVRWGKWGQPKVAVLVDGRRKKLVQLAQGDTSFSRRPAELIRNVEELLAIPDEEFQKYSPLQRSNLVAKFSVNWPFSLGPPVTNSAATVSPSNSVLVK